MRRDPRVLVNLDALARLSASGKRRNEVIDFLKALHPQPIFRAISMSPIPKAIVLSKSTSSRDMPSHGGRMIP